MTKKYLHYAVINTVANVVIFFLLIVLMFAEIISFSVVVIVLSPLGIEQEPGFIFNFISFALNIYPIIAIASIAGTWIAYYKKSKKYFNFFVSLSWGYVSIVVLIYFGRLFIY